MYINIKKFTITDYNPKVVRNANYLLLFLSFFDKSKVEL
jgi:hypothetical protein